MMCKGLPWLHFSNLEEELRQFLATQYSYFVTTDNQFWRSTEILRITGKKKKLHLLVLNLFNFGLKYEFINLRLQKIMQNPKQPKGKIPHRYDLLHKCNHPYMCMDMRVGL